MSHISVNHIDWRCMVSGDLSDIFWLFDSRNVFATEKQLHVSTLYDKKNIWPPPTYRRSIDTLKWRRCDYTVIDIRLVTVDFTGLKSTRMQTVLDEMILCSTSIYLSFHRLRRMHVRLPQCLLISGQNSFHIFGENVQIVCFRCSIAASTKQFLSFCIPEAMRYLLCYEYVVLSNFRGRIKLLFC